MHLPQNVRTCGLQQDSSDLVHICVFVACGLRCISVDMCMMGVMRLQCSQTAPPAGVLMNWTHNSSYSFKENQRFKWNWVKNIKIRNRNCCDFVENLI